MSQVGFFAPICHLEQIELSDGNAALVKWGHKMGECKRPMGLQVCHGLFQHGELTALAISAALINETAAGFNRHEAFELARLCAERSGINRVMLRLWREFVFPSVCKAHGYKWAISYQDEKLHNGNTYRFDGWVKIAENQRSGTDKRSGRIGRVKTVWGWNPDPVARRLIIDQKISA